MFKIKQTCVGKQRDKIIIFRHRKRQQVAGRALLRSISRKDSQTRLKRGRCNVITLFSQAVQNCVVSSIAQNGKAWQIYLCFRVTENYRKIGASIQSQLEVGRQQSKKRQRNFWKAEIGELYWCWISTTEFNNNILLHQLYDFNTTSFSDTLGCFISLAQEDSVLIPTN